MDGAQTNQKRLIILLLVSLLIAADAGEQKDIIEQGCRCLTREFCNIYLGSHPEDRLLLNTFSKCDDPLLVRCCGVAITEKLTLTNETNPNKIEKSSTELASPELPPINELIYFKLKTASKTQETVSLVYPSEVSGIPKTTAMNMSESGMMKSVNFDKTKPMFIVFSESVSTDPLKLDESTTLTTITMAPATVTEQLEVNVPITETTSTTKTLKLGLYDKPKRKFMTAIHNDNNSSKLTEDSTKVPFKLTTKEPKPLYPKQDSSVMINRRKELFNQVKVSHKPLTPHIMIESLITTEASVKTEKPKLDIPEEEYIKNRIGRQKSPQIETSTRKITTLQSTTPKFQPKPNLAAKDIAMKRMDNELKDSIDDDHKTMVESLHLMLSSLAPVNISETVRSFSATMNNNQLLEDESKMKDKITAMVKKMISIKTNLENGNGFEDSTLLASKQLRGQKRYMIPIHSNLLDTRFSSADTESIQSSSAASRLDLNSNKIKQRRPMNSFMRKIKITTTSTTPSSLSSDVEIPSTTVSYIFRRPVRPIQLNRRLLKIMPENERKESEDQGDNYRKRENSREREVLCAKATRRRASRDVMRRDAPPSNIGPSFHSGKPLSIVGPIPKGFMVREDVSNVDLQLPQAKIVKFA